MTIHIIGKGGMAKDWIYELIVIQEYRQPDYSTPNLRRPRPVDIAQYEGHEIEDLCKNYDGYDPIYFCLGYPKDRKRLYDSLISNKIIKTSDLGFEHALALQHAPEMHFSNAFIGADAKIGKQVLLHTHSSVGHDSVIGDFVSLMPGARVSGKCEVGEGVMIGANAVIFPGVKVGAWAQIGAGCVIARDVNPGEVWVAGLSRCVRVEDER